MSWAWCSWQPARLSDTTEALAWCKTSNGTSRDDVDRWFEFLSKPPTLDRSKRRDTRSQTDQISPMPWEAPMIYHRCGDGSCRGLSRGRSSTACCRGPQPLALPFQALSSRLWPALQSQRGHDERAVNFASPLLLLPSPEPAPTPTADRHRVAAAKPGRRSRKAV